MSTQAPLLDQGRAVVLVSYSQFHVVVGGEPMIDALPSIDTWRNSNGLFVLGSGGFMVVTTGIHTGEVTVAVEAHSIEPPLDLSWEEVAEVSLEVIEIPPTHNPSPEGRDLLRVASMEDGVVEDLLPLNPQGAHQVRVRVHAANRAHNVGGLDEEPVERYLLQAWPAQI